MPGGDQMIKYVELCNLRPNNWFLDRNKLERIRKAWNDGKQELLPAVIVTMIDEELGLLDGHCRAFVAWENGARFIRSDVVSFDEIGSVNSVRDLHVIFHRQGQILGIKNVWDLGKRIYDLSDTTDPDLAVLIEGTSARKKESDQALDLI